MKNIFLAVSLLSIISAARCQFLHQFIKTQQETYQPLVDAQEITQFSYLSKQKDLGFSFTQHGFTCSKVGLEQGTISLDFENTTSYFLSMSPLVLDLKMAYTHNYNLSKYYIKRGTDVNGLKNISIEIRDMEYNEYPGEKLNYMVIINEKGEIKLIVGPNSVKSQSILNTRFFGGLSEADYIKNTTFPEREDYYYAKLNLLYGDPNNPSISERTDTTLFFNSIPSAGTAYYFTPMADGISIKDRRKVTISPNPVKKELTIDRINCGSAIIFSLSGQELMQFEITDNSIDVSKLKAGSYLLKVTMRDGEHKIIQFIKE